MASGGPSERGARESARLSCPGRSLGGAALCEVTVLRSQTVMEITVPWREKQAGVSVPIETASICREAHVRAWTLCLRGWGQPLEGKVICLLSGTLLPAWHVRKAPFSLDSQLFPQRGRLPGHVSATQEFLGRF